MVRLSQTQARRSRAPAGHPSEILKSIRRCEYPSNESHRVTGDGAHASARAVQEFAGNDHCICMLPFSVTAEPTTRSSRMTHPSRSARYSKSRWPSGRNSNRIVFTVQPSDDRAAHAPRYGAGSARSAPHGGPWVHAWDQHWVPPKSQCGYQRHESGARHDASPTKHVVGSPGPSPRLHVGWPTPWLSAQNTSALAWRRTHLAPPSLKQNCPNCSSYVGSAAMAHASSRLRGHGDRFVQDDRQQRAAAANHFHFERPIGGRSYQRSPRRCTPDHSIERAPSRASTSYPFGSRRRVHHRATPSRASSLGRRRSNRHSREDIARREGCGAGSRSGSPDRDALRRERPPSVRAIVQLCSASSLEPVMLIVDGLDPRAVTVRSSCIVLVERSSTPRSIENCTSPRACPRPDALMFGAPTL